MVSWGSVWSNLVGTEIQSKVGLLKCHGDYLQEELMPDGAFTSYYVPKRNKSPAGIPYNLPPGQPCLITTAVQNL